jgi:hypothetical protein
MTEILLAVFALLSVADIWTTYLFPRYGLREGNPILARLMGQHGFDELYLAKYVVFVGVLVAAHQGWAPLWLIGAACVAQGVVVAWNLYHIWRRRSWNQQK